MKHARLSVRTAVDRAGRLAVLLLGALALSLATGCSNRTAKPAVWEDGLFVATDPKVDAALNALCEFFDGDRALEDTLRQNFDRIDDAAFLQRHPAWAAYCIRHPEGVAALKVEPEFFADRSLERYALEQEVLLRRDDLVQLHDFAKKYPDILPTINRAPWLLLRSAFLSNHPGLGRFIDEHTGLNVAFAMSLMDAESSRKA